MPPRRDPAELPSLRRLALIGSLILGANVASLGLSTSARAQDAAPSTVDPPPEPVETPPVPDVGPGADDPASAAPTPVDPAPEEPAPAPTAEPPPPSALTPPPPPAEQPPPPPPEAPKRITELDPQVKFGVGLRAQYDIDPGGNGREVGQSIGTNIRPYIAGQINGFLKFEANLDSAFYTTLGTGSLTVDPVTGTVAPGAPDGSIPTSSLSVIRPLDAVIKIEPHPLVNFWIGRFLPPSDRANLSGPYFMNSWNYPVDSNLFPAAYAGRSDGIAYWGQVKNGLFKWQLGMFDVTGGRNPRAAARVVLNILDPEPGYYNSSTYYGTKDVLAIAATFQYQNDGNVATGEGIDGAAFNADVLFEKVLGKAGTMTLEGAYYNFMDTNQGQSFSALFSYLLPGKQGFGTIQPGARLQYMFPDTGDAYATFDGALNYIVNGHSARFSLNYQFRSERNTIPNGHLLTLGGQFQL